MDNNKPQLIDLWRTSFDDSEEFIKLFFDRVYKKENALFPRYLMSPGFTSPKLCLAHESMSS